MPEVTENTTTETAPRRRGRPPGTKNATVAKVNGAATPAPKAKRGRKPAMEPLTPPEMLKVAAWLKKLATLSTAFSR